MQKNWEKELRTEVQNALRSLPTNEGKLLSACFGCTEHDNIDTENALFYNFAAPVGNATKHGVFFSRYSVEDTNALLTGLGKAGFRYYYKYTIEPNEPEEFFVNRRGVEWTEIPIRPLYGGQRAFGFFEALRSNPESFFKPTLKEITGNFGIDIKIKSPDTKLISIDKIMKPMLDGVVSAFHKLPTDISIDKICTPTRSLAHGDHERLRRLLLQERNAILPPYKFVVPYRENSLIWSPQDNNLTEARISIKYGADQWSFSGIIYELIQSSFVSD